jgi:hypothetical protein
MNTLSHTGCRKNGANDKWGLVENLKPEQNVKEGTNSLEVIIT